MAVSDFEELCCGFCELAGVPAPALGADAQGNIAFNLVTREVTVDFIYCDARSADHLFVLFELGPFHENDDVSHSALRNLLSANFMPLQVHPPVFARNPANGDAVLQYVSALSDTSPSRLLELLEEGVETALLWREGAFAVAQREYVTTDVSPRVLAGFA